MPAPDTTVPGAPIWVDIFTSDPERARAFYSELFGWVADEGVEEFGGYFNFTKDGKRVAGGMKNDGAMGAPDTWTIYLASSDADATVAAAEAAGGHVVVPVGRVGDLGRFAVLGDPGGAGVGLWESGAHTGFEVIGEPGTPSWFELHTSEYDASLAFYRDVFGWVLFTAVDTPEFRYTTHTGPEPQYAGVVDASQWRPEGPPAEWFVYFGVDDADKTVEQVVELGGAVIDPAEDTPYGRLATVSDPTGTKFKLLGPNVGETHVG
jgi:predicted enzyme related to lactoylglutathione lyase